MNTNDDRLLRLSQVLELLPISRSTWWAWVKSGKAPAPVRISEGITCWRKSEVMQMIRGASS
jgi:prophage regulatory protein